jgi:hypothetical protein
MLFRPPGVMRLHLAYKLGTSTRAVPLKAKELAPKKRGLFSCFKRAKAPNRDKYAPLLHSIVQPGNPTTASHSHWD